MAFILGIALVAALVYLAFREGYLPPRRNKHQDELLRLCRGDQGQADRLLALEQDRRPALTAEAAAKAAVYSLKRDNR